MSEDVVGLCYIKLFSVRMVKKSGEKTNLFGGKRILILEATTQWRTMAFETVGRTALNYVKTISL